MGPQKSSRRLCWGWCSWRKQKSLNTRTSNSRAVGTEEGHGRQWGPEGPFSLSSGGHLLEMESRFWGLWARLCRLLVENPWSSCVLTNLQGPFASVGHLAILQMRYPESPSDQHTQLVSKQPKVPVHLVVICRSPHLKWLPSAALCSKHSQPSLLPDAPHTGLKEVVGLEVQAPRTQASSV